MPRSHHRTLIKAGRLGEASAAVIAARLAAPPNAQETVRMVTEKISAVHEIASSKAIASLPGVLCAHGYATLSWWMALCSASGPGDILAANERYAKQSTALTRAGMRLAGAVINPLDRRVQANRRRLEA